MSDSFHVIFKIIIPQCLYLIGYIGNLTALIALIVRKPLAKYPARNIYLSIIVVDTLKVSINNLYIFYQNINIISDVHCKLHKYVKISNNLFLGVTNKKI